MRSAQSTTSIGACNLARANSGNLRAQRRPKRFRHTISDLPVAMGRRAQADERWPAGARAATMAINRSGEQELACARVFKPAGGCSISALADPKVAYRLQWRPVSPWENDLVRFRERGSWSGRFTEASPIVDAAI